MPHFATRPPIGATLLLLAMIITGCDQPAPTSTLDTPMPSAAAAKAERTTGAVVFHGVVPGGLLMIDFDRERTLLVGNTAAQLADICAGGAFPSEVTEHDVFAPNGAIHVLVRAGRLPAVVYPVLSIDPCAELQGVTPLAEGIAKGVYTDNDAVGGSKGANSFGLIVVGDLTETATGLPVQLHAKFRNVFLPDGTIKLPVNEIILR
jgi:hypothetical protein